MRMVITLILMMSLASSATATDLGNTQRILKDNSHVGLNPGTPDGRQGGEDMASAVLIDALPFAETGNTSDNVDDYDVVCPYSGSNSPDVVYSYTPATDIVVSVDLCGSGYDTKTYIFDSEQNEIACNDDAYNDEICGQYVSMIEEAFLTGGETYFFVIDGYGGDSGDYILAIDEFEVPPPCILDIPDHENEPAIVDGYMDDFNGGCNSPEFGNPFSDFSVGCNSNGDLTRGGQAGWYISADGGNSRDTDWYMIVIGLEGVVEWTLDAEQESYGFHLGPNDCGSVGVIDQILVGPCAPLTMVLQGAPGDIAWLWVGATVWEAPGGFEGNEYKYRCDFTGLYPEYGVSPTDKITFDGVKSLYR